jgi:hypothetical protein
MSKNELFPCFINSKNLKCFGSFKTIISDDKRYVMPINKNQ